MPPVHPKSPARLDSRRASFPARLATVGSAAALALACGGRGAKAPPADAGARDAGADAASRLTISPPPSGMPPMAVMPPPGVVGSKRATKKADPSLATCGGSTSVVASSPVDHVRRIGEGCSAASKMKPIGSVLRGQQADRGAHQEARFRAEANRCYRVYFAADAGVKDVVVVLRDSAGDVIAEATGPAVPEGGSACFTTADDVTILVAIGHGQGAWAAQVWGD